MDSPLIPLERIESKIYLIRGQKIMLDRDLAELYGVPTRVLNQAVRRNQERFPEDFLFNLSEVELKNWKSQIVTSNWRSQSVTARSMKMGLRKPPLAFTEQGIAMLSSVLKSGRAIAVNIQIIRTFTKLRTMIAENDDLRRKLEIMEKQYDEQFKIVFDALRRLLDDNDSPGSEIGFRD
jgi:hypothetical protein